MLAASAGQVTGLDFTEDHSETIIDYTSNSKTMNQDLQLMEIRMILEDEVQ